MPNKPVYPITEEFKKRLEAYLQDFRRSVGSMELTFEELASAMASWIGENEHMGELKPKAIKDAAAVFLDFLYFLPLQLKAEAEEELEDERGTVGYDNSSDAHD